MICNQGKPYHMVSILQHFLERDMITMTRIETNLLLRQQSSQKRKNAKSMPFNELSEEALELGASYDKPHLNKG